MIRIAWVAVLVVSLSATPAMAAVDIFVDFVSDIGDGFGGAANGTADWIDNLGILTANAGVASFSPAERATIEADVLSRLSDMFSPFDAVTVGTVSSGSEERISFGAFNASPNVFGSAPLDFMNLRNHTGSVGTASKVYSHNFARFIEAFEPRNRQIAEVGAALAGTAAHEVGHAIGLQHHHAYGTELVSPANYASTGGAQNAHVMATGSTGLSETGREVARDFSTMSKLMVEAAGGASGVASTSLVSSPLIQTNSDFGPGDVGNTTAMARSLALTALSVSGLESANTLGELENASDVDVYSFTVDNTASLWAQVWSDDRYANDFDTFLRLYDTDGSTVLASNDNVQYNGSSFGSGTLREEDSALLNIALPTAGTYFLEVSNLGPVIGEGEPDNGGVYSLIFGAAVEAIAVPEPGSFGFLAVATCISIRLRRRRDAT